MVDNRTPFPIGNGQFKEDGMVPMTSRKRDQKEFQAIHIVAVIRSRPGLSSNLQWLVCALNNLEQTRNDHKFLSFTEDEEWRGCCLIKVTVVEVKTVVFSHLANLAELEGNDRRRSCSL